MEVEKGSVGVDDEHVAGGSLGDVAGDRAEDSTSALYSLVAYHDHRRVQTCRLVDQPVGHVAHHHGVADRHRQLQLAGHRPEVIFGDTHGVDHPHLRAAAMDLSTVVALHRCDDVQR